jgi:hypothetical protein
MVSKSPQTFEASDSPAASDGGKGVYVRIRDSQATRACMIDDFSQV